MSPETNARKSSGLVIVVEDDPMTRRIYDAGLRKLGFTVLSAPTGEDGLGLMSQHQAKVVILDIDLPGISGIEVCQRSRTMPAGTAPVIFITGNDTVDILRQCVAVGGDDFLIKGGPLTALLERVSYWSRGASRRLNDRQRRMIVAKTSEIIDDLEASVLTPAAPADEGAGMRFGADNPEVARIAEAFDRLRHKWPNLTDNSVTARLRRFGYVTGLVNAAASSRLDMKVQFMDYLRSAMIVCNVVRENEVARMFENWHQLYDNPNFSDALEAGERDFAEMYGEH